jgi:hypothetical protein
MDNGGPTPGTEFKPGDTITPGQVPPAAPAATAPAQPTVEASNPVVQSPQQAPAAPMVIPEVPPQQPAANPLPQQPVQQAAEITPSPSPYALPTDEPELQADLPPTPGGERTVTWTAPEFVAHHKPFGWYALLGLSAIVVAGIVWLLFKDAFSSIVVLVVAILFGAYGARKPRDIQILVDMHGITLNQKFRDYNEFRSFSVVHDGSQPSIVLLPLKRFGMIVTIYYDLENENAIVEELSLHLPYAEHQADPIDALMHRLRF